MVHMYGIIRDVCVGVGGLGRAECGNEGTQISGGAEIGECGTGYRKQFKVKV